MQSFECVILHHKTTNITNNMKRLTLILMLVLSMAAIVSAEQKSVPLEYKKTCNDNKHTKVHRAPERIPVINVYYDNDTHLITAEIGYRLFLGDSFSISVFFKEMIPRFLDTQIADEYSS